LNRKELQKENGRGRRNLIGERSLCMTGDWVDKKMKSDLGGDSAEYHLDVWIDGNGDYFAAKAIIEKSKSRGMASVGQINHLIEGDGVTKREKAGGAKHTELQPGVGDEFFKQVGKKIQGCEKPIEKKRTQKGTQVKSEATQSKYNTARDTNGIGTREGEERCIQEEKVTGETKIIKNEEKEKQQRRRNRSDYCGTWMIGCSGESLARLA